MNSSFKKFPYEIKKLSPEKNKELLRYFHGERTGFVQVGPERYFFPQSFEKEAENFYNFQARSDDVWVVTCPRSGTTWTQELVWLLANNLDFEVAARKPLTERFPFFEFSLFMHPEVKADLLRENSHSQENCDFIERISRPGYELLDNIPHTTQRFIKSHFPFSLLPPSIMDKRSKVIYVLRNPLDVSVSYYHLNRLFRTQGYVGGFQRYWNYFQQGLNPWLPYYSHIKEALAMSHLPSVLLLHYEDMKQDLRKAIIRVADFLNVHISVEGMENLLNHLEFNNFCRNKSVNMHEMGEVGILNKGEAGFVRRGSESLQQEFTDNPELLESAKNWVRKKEKKFITTKLNKTT